MALTLISNICFCASSCFKSSLLNLLCLSQLVLSGPSAPAALRSVSVSSRTPWSVTVVMAPVPVNLVTRATPARKVSTLSQYFAHQLTLLTFTPLNYYCTVTVWITADFIELFEHIYSKVCTKTQGNNKKKSQNHHP